MKCSFYSCQNPQQFFTVLNGNVRPICHQCFDMYNLMWYPTRLQMYTSLPDAELAAVKERL